jgi:hypothetical protein
MPSGWQRILTKAAGAGRLDLPSCRQLPKAGRWWARGCLPGCQVPRPYQVPAQSLPELLAVVGELLAPCN